MPRTRIPKELSSTTGIVDNSNATAITIDVNENVGIGIGSPTGVLTSYRSSNGDPVLGHFYNDNGGTATEAVVYITNSSTASDGLFLEATGTAFTTTGGFVQDGVCIGSGSGASGGLSIMTRANADMRFYTNGHTNERMRIDSSGNVGIGTSSPASALDVQTANAGSGIRLTSTTGTNGVSYKATNTAGNLYMGIDTSAGGSFGNANAAVFWYDAAQSMIFATNNSKRMTIDSSGNVVIGSGGLDVSGVGGTYTALNMRAGAGYPILYGQTTATTTNSSAMQIVGATSGASAGGAAELLGVIQIAAESDSSTNATGYINFYTGSGGSVTERMRLTSDGEVLINVTSNNNDKNKLLIYRDGVAYGGVENSYWSAGTALTLQTASGTSNSTIGINFLVYNNTDANNAYINAVANGSANDGADLVFGRRTGVSTYAESMRIDRSGNVGIGNGTTYNMGDGYNFYNRGPTGGGSPRGSNIHEVPNVWRNWFVYASPSNSGSTYLHMKTNLAAGSNGTSNVDYTMSLFRYRAYCYAGSNSVASGMLGWHNWNGTFYNEGKTNDTPWAVVQSSYVSSDGYVVLVAYMQDSYCHVEIDWSQWAGYAFRERKVTAYTTNASATGAY